MTSVAIYGDSFGSTYENAWPQYYEENFHIRTNHLTKIQNIEFAKYLYMHMKKENFDIHGTFSEPKKYYTMSKNLETSGFIFK